MALTSDRRRRIEKYLDALKQRLITRVAPVEMEMAITYELLSPEEASGLSFVACPVGTQWGAQWQYGWFRGSAVLPKSVEGKRVEFLFRSGEAIVYVNRRLVGGINRGHATVLLSEQARAGERYDILVEAYAGHGPTPTSAGPVRDRESLIPQVPDAQQVFQEASIVVFDEEAYQLYMDLLTLYDSIGSMDENSLRRHKIEKSLLDATFIIDLEGDSKSYAESVRKAREFLRPILAATNGSTAPEMFCIGHAHIDVAWLWPLAQTIRKAGATFATALGLMKEYPEYRFLQSQPQLYAYVKEYYPEVFQEIKKAVASGQWIVDGGLWVECDTNLVGGESLIRQFLYGKRFMREEFGVDSKVMWLPDVFGYSAALPQIMKGCGVEYFSTHKIFWNYNGGTVFPYDTFIWEGIDGTTVLAHNHRNYNAETKPSSIIWRWNKAIRKEETDVLLYPFGWGDGGGGPTRDHLEFLRRLKDFEGVPRTRQSSLEEFFEEVERRGAPKSRYVGELYFEAHRGVYTSQARTKLLNRKSEFALRDAELWSALAAVANGRDYPAETLERLWKQVLLNQFHDILPGSSIGRVYEEANSGYARVINDAGSVSAASRNTFLRQNPAAYTVWNSLSWDRPIFVELPVDSGIAVDSQGNPLDQQVVTRSSGQVLLVRVPSVPALGARTVYVDPGTGAKRVDLAADATALMHSGGVSAVFDSVAREYVLENEFLKLRVDSRGEITSLYDKEADRELAANGRTLNRMELYQDQPSEYDAWDIDISYKEKPIELDGSGNARLLASGPLEARLRVERRIHKSVMIQDIVLRSGERRVDFETEVDWDETHKLLKVAFPVDVHSVDARYEIQFGHIRRARHQNTEFEKARFEVSGHKWMDVSEAAYGVAILNDCKYGWDTLDGVPRLTLLRAPVAPDPNADRGRHVFKYALLPHNEPFGESVVRAGYELNAPAHVDSGELPGGMYGPAIVVSKANVIVETVKRSEDRTALVVRMYECLGQRTKCRVELGFGFAEAAECNLIEENRYPLLPNGRSIDLVFRPFEIKTVLLKI